MARQSLARAAKGLPRYYMDVGWWRSRRFAGAPLEAIGLMSCIVGYCTEHSTDGRLPANHEDLAAALGVRASSVRKALRALLDRQVLVEDGHELVVRGWGDHNPTKAEVDAYTEERSNAGLRGNHERWHTARGVVDPGCPFCTTDPPPDPGSESHSDRSSDPTAIAGASHGMGWDGIGEQSSSTTTPHGPVDSPDDDHAAWLSQQLLELAEADLARREAEKGPVGNRDGWLRSSIGGHRKRLEADPDYLDQALARAAQRPTPSPLDNTLAAQAQRMAANAARAADAPPRDPTVLAHGLAQARAATRTETP